MKKRRIALLNSILALLLCVAMLAGSTFAWFTDSVTSTGNIIQSGTLDVELEYWDGSDWKTVQGATQLFGEDLWEPGYTEVLYLKVSNKGNLALKWQLAINIESEDPGTNKAGDSFKLSDHIYMGVVEDMQPEFSDREAAVAAVEGSSGIIGNGFSGFGEMDAGAAEQYLAVVVYMPTSVDNVANHNGVDDATIDMGIALLATQKTAESDSFGSDYDTGAQFPTLKGDASGSAAVETENGVTTGETTINTNTDVNATVPAGVKVEEGAETLDLTVSNGISRSDNISMVTGEVSRSFDVHIAGVAEDNDVPMIINLGAILPTDMKDANVRLIHVENGVPVEMTKVDTLTAHNQYTYDPATGEVSVCMASFSEVTAVVASNDPWTGAIDTSWYNTTDTNFAIDTEEKLAGLGAIVGGMVKDAEGNTIQDDFSGKTITLNADLDLGGEQGRVWYPIGYGNNTKSYEKISGGSVTSDVYSFEGTFNGNGHTISNIYQNTWEMFGDYNDGYSGTPNHYDDGMGLFGFVLNGTVQNLTVTNFQSDGEFCTTGVVAAYASGESTFKDITITKSNPRAYNVPNGGVVGYAYAENGQNNVINFNNVKVDSSNKISALWGSWDVGCGGVLGRVNGATTVNMTNCEVGAVIDVFNDVCGNYQYYQYRYSGMLIGTVGGDGNPSTGAETVNFSNVKVYIGNWADYYYCEFEKNSGASYTDDFQFSRVEKDDINFNPDTNLPDFDNSPCKHEHTEKEDKMGLYLPFNQLYTGYGWGSSPVVTADGVTIERQFYSITYMDGDKVVAVEYQTDGTRTDDKVWANEYTNLMEYSVSGKTFNGWVNVGSVKKTSIEAGNRNDVVLYATFKNICTIRWLDEDGNVISSQTVDSGTQYRDLVVPANPESSTPDVLEFDHWEVRNTDGTSTSLEDLKKDNKKVSANITIYPYWRVKSGAGTLGLTGHDDDGDGKVDRYTVEAASGLSGEITIPGDINGVPVTVITDLSSDFVNGEITSIIIKDGVQEIASNAFAMTSGLKEVTIPLSVTKIGANAFANTIGGSLISKKLEINFAGTKAEWDAVNKTDGWEHGLVTGTTVICTDGVYTLTAYTILGFGYYEWEWTSN